eukprot:GHVU01058078.1.p1 GENE.GHVU01058078.1~~GHVU01058078.1.p1  ORF type:complete len:171 (+),score=5.02 GHVU01058078.1:140-652(+)
MHEVRRPALSATKPTALPSGSLALPPAVGVACPIAVAKSLIIAAQPTGWGPVGFEISPGASPATWPWPYWLKKSSGFQSTRRRSSLRAMKQPLPFFRTMAQPPNAAECTVGGGGSTTEVVKQRRKLSRAGGACTTAVDSVPWAQLVHEETSAEMCHTSRYRPLVRHCARE